MPLEEEEKCGRVCKWRVVCTGGVVVVVVEKRQRVECNATAETPLVMRDRRRYNDVLLSRDHDDALVVVSSVGDARH